MPLESFESHSLLPDLVRRGGTVIDCGANVGHFSRLMIDRFDATVFAFEASPAVFGVLRQVPGLVSRNVAVCGTDGPVKLRVEADSTWSAISHPSRALEDRVSYADVNGYTLERLLVEAGVTGEIEVLKLDIEGAELAVLDSLSDERLLSIGQITIEFHDFLGYHTADEIEQRVQRLVQLGFREFYWSRSRNTGDVLLVNGDRVSRIRHVVEQELIRPARAVARLVDRALSSRRQT